MSTAKLPAAFAVHPPSMTLYDGVITFAIVAVVCMLFYVGWLTLDCLQAKLGSLVSRKREVLHGVCYDCGEDCQDGVRDEISHGNPQFFCRACAEKRWPSREA
ncbi:hypothetical protein [Lignipirellula cremea]|uniref:Uncharacterized protein n=1 Tax=Lignipirellula cremea TaxID=2528010 RepID=A0A518DVL6_9BACT|nr:hypothetical protein [Lignipirellula cremea]QDU95878.1 hypothetical protein Pla8534_36970 [Lignipirellula cremea]